MTAPFQTDHRTALAGLAIIAVGTGWLLCSTRFAVLVARVVSRREPYLDEQAETFGFDRHCDTAMTLANNDAEAAATARREAAALVGEAYRAMRSESA